MQYHRYNSGHELELLSTVITSSGQFPGDFGRGTVGDFGDYDRCLQPKFPIVTHYCMASFLPREELLESEQSVSRIDSFYRTEFLPELNFYVKVGLCMPKECSSHDIDTILDEGELVRKEMIS